MERGPRLDIVIATQRARKMAPDLPQRAFGTEPPNKRARTMVQAYEMAGNVLSPSERDVAIRLCDWLLNK
jgi:hypothetical protein